MRTNRPRWAPRYCKKVPPSKKLTQQIGGFSQNAVAFAGVLIIAMGKWHGNMHFGAKAEITIFYSY
jgi:hypothetical protein